MLFKTEDKIRKESINSDVERNMRHCVLCETRPYAWVIVYCEIGPCVWEQDLVSLFPVYDRALFH
jgi:hypothetical protein